MSKEVSALLIVKFSAIAISYSNCPHVSLSLYFRMITCAVSVCTFVTRYLCNASCDYMRAICMCCSCLTTMRLTNTKSPSSLLTIAKRQLRVGALTGGSFSLFLCYFMYTLPLLAFFSLLIVIVAFLESIRSSSLRSPWQIARPSHLSSVPSCMFVLMSITMQPARVR